MSSNLKHNLFLIILTIIVILISFFIIGFISSDSFNKITQSILPHTQLAQVSSSLNQGLVAHYTFDEGSGTTAGDSAGSNTGTLVGGPTWTSGKVGSGALSFDGGDDYVSLANIDRASNESITITGWFKTTSATAGNVIWGQRQGNSIFVVTVNNWVGGGTTNKLNFSIRDANGAGLQTRTSSVNVNDGIWHHFAAVRNIVAGEVRLYVDGVSESNNANIATGAITTTNGVAIGRENVQGTYFTGTIDEVRVYNRALSTQEISDVYNDTGEPATPPSTSAPSIYSFTATPSVINEGQSATLSWFVSGSPTPTLTIDQGIGNVTNQTSILVSPITTTNYTLTAQNSVSTASQSISVTVNPQVSDIQTPSIPSNLSVTAISSSQINLTWTASTDNIGVTGYRVYRNGTQVDTPSTNSYSDTGLSASTQYSYTVVAYDAAENVSGQSSSVNANTQGQNGPTANGNIVIAASCSRADVQSAINVAPSGGTVIVPAGNCSWGDGERVIISGNYAYPSININKSLILKGLYPSITGSGSGYFIYYNPVDYSQNFPLRITGFTFDGGGSRSGIFFAYSASNLTIQNKIRIDHNTFRNLFGQALWINGQRGVADNNVFTGEYPFRFSSGDSGDWWNNWEGLIFGKADNNFYIEDNMIEVGSILADCQYGNRYAFRYNNITVKNGSYPFLDMHGNQGIGLMYACFGGEIYGNNISAIAGQMLDQRAGRVVAFYNNAQGLSFGIKVREEVGDNYNPSTNIQPQHVSDSYYWNNRNGFSGPLLTAYLAGNDCDQSINTSINTCDDARDGYSLNNNDEWHQDATNFDASGGVGCGTLLNRSTTCTVGVGYWATNQSCNLINSANIGANPIEPISGTLYKCTSPNTWTAFYTPYTYPHPLRTSETIPPPPTEPPTCSSFTYSSWGTCSNNTQVRTILSSTPSGCTGGTPTITQSCTITPTQIPPSPPPPFIPPSTPPPVIPPINQDLTPTQTSNDIATLNTFLYNEGYLSTPSPTPNTYTPETIQAVQAFQKTNNIITYGTPDTTGYGIVGPKTKQVINSIINNKYSGNTTNTTISKRKPQPFIPIPTSTPEQLDNTTPTISWFTILKEIIHSIYTNILKGAQRTWEQIKGIV